MERSTLTGAFLLQKFKKVIGIEKIKCPYCGYEMPIFVEEYAEAKGVFIKCKGKHCKKIFELNIKSK